MTISPELEAQILRYHHVEKWRKGTIARQLGVHPYTVARVLGSVGVLQMSPPNRPSRIDAYLPFILETLEAYPKLTAARLFDMARYRLKEATERARQRARHRPRVL